MGGPRQVTSERRPSRIHSATSTRIAEPISRNGHSGIEIRSSGQIVRKTEPMNVLALHRSEHGGVARRLTVVAEHEVRVRWHVHGRERLRLHAHGQVRLRELPSVDVDVAVVAFDRVVREPHDALDQILDVRGGGSGRRLEHHDVAAVRVAEVVAELVDEHAVADLERRDHRRRRDVEGLEDERPHDERDQQRGDDQHHPLDDRTTARRARLGRRRRIGGRGLGLLEGDPSGG